MSKRLSGKTSGLKPGPLPLALGWAAFVGLGMPDGMFGVAWPTMRLGFGVPIDAIGWAMAAGTAGYLAASFSCGRVLARIPVAGFLALSCACAGAALVADCLVPSWAWFALVSLALGLGAGGIDAGLNTHLAAERGPREMHWLHACFGVGATLGPFLMTACLRSLGGWRPGYLAVGGLQLALAAAFALSLPVRPRPAEAGRRRPGPRRGGGPPLLETLALPSAWTGMLLFFLYSGAEISLGFWAYTILTQARGVPPAAAGMLAGGFYAMFTLGRILSGFYSRRLSPDSIVLAALVVGLAGSLLLWLDPGPVLSLSGMVLTGFAVAPVFPSLVSGTRDRVGRRHAGNAVGMQMAAAGLGGACLPALMGVLARRVSVEAITGALLALFAAVLLAFLAARRAGRP